MRWLRGVTWALLNSFQACGFHLALGYRQFGAHDDYPAGHIRYFLYKRLIAAIKAPSQSTARQRHLLACNVLFKWARSAPSR
jgi:hypothetical protein